MSLNYILIYIKWLEMPKDTDQYEMFETLVKQQLTKCHIESNHSWLEFRLAFETNLVNTLTEQRDQCQEDLFKMSAILEKMREKNAPVVPVTNASLETYSTQLATVTSEIQQWQEKMIKCEQDKKEAVEVQKAIDDTQDALELLKMMADWELTSNTALEQTFTFRNLVTLKIVNRSWNLEVNSKNLMKQFNRRIPLAVWLYYYFLIYSVC